MSRSATRAMMSVALLVGVTHCDRERATDVPSVEPVLLPPAITSFTADDETLLLGDSATLRWSIQRATSATIDPGIGSVDPVSGSAIVALADDATLTLTARNSAGVVTAAVSVSVVTPIDPPAHPDISAGRTHGLAVGISDRAVLWGSNTYGQICNAGQAYESPVPFVVSSLSDVRQVAGGAYHSAILLDDGTVHSCGDNVYGQLGAEDGSEGYPSSQTPLAATGIDTAVAVAAGGYHSLALLIDGTVMAFGDNEHGQLGNNSSVAESQEPVVVTLPGPAVAISAGYEHNFALLDDRRLMAWGWNEWGQVGNQGTTDVKVPIEVVSLPDGVEVSSMAAGLLHSMVLATNGSVWTWGENSDGTLGNGTFENSTSPVQVSGLDDVVTIATGYNHCMAIDSLGAVYVWGDNFDGQLGDGTDTDSNVPKLVNGLPGPALYATAGRTFSMVRLVNGEVWIWGRNTWGELGNGTTEDSWIPIQLSGPV